MLQERKSGLARWDLQKKLLMETLKCIKQMRRNAIKGKGKRIKEEAWDNYFKCDGLPHSFRPDEIHSYLTKWNFEIEKDLRQEYDWSLKSDELSILTQDKNVPDKSIKKLKLHRTEYAMKIVEKINEVEFILKGLRRSLHIDSELFTKADRIALRDFQRNLHDNLRKCIDIYTHEIMKNMERDMKPVEISTEHGPDYFSTKLWGLREAPKQKDLPKDPTSLQHSFSHEKFSIHFWSLRDVPQPKRSYHDRFRIPLDSFGGEATFPYASEMKNLAFRSYWSCYDHYSTECPTYAIQTQPPPIVDMLTAMLREWDHRERIEQIKTTELDSKRMDFEKFFNASEHDVGDKISKSSLAVQMNSTPIDKKRLHGRTKASPRRNKGKIKKMEIKKMSFGNIEQYNSKAEYVFNEDNEYLQQLESMKPSKVNLLPGDINLRQYQIFGGVFHLNYFPKPCRRREFLISHMIENQCTLPSSINHQLIKLDQDDSRKSNKTAANSVSMAQSPRPSEMLEPPRTILLHESASNPTAEPQKRSSVMELLKLEDSTFSKTEYISPQKLQSLFGRNEKRPSLIERLRKNELPVLEREPEVPIDGIVQIDAELEKLVIIDFKIKLPPNMKLWKAPTICYWEPREKSEEFLKLSKDVQDFHLLRQQYDENYENRSFNSTPPRMEREKAIKDFRMLQVPKSVDLDEICKDYIIPALPYHYRNSIDIMLDQKADDEIKRQKRIKAGIATTNLDPIKAHSIGSEAEPNLPRPLFIPREKLLHLRIVPGIESNDEQAHEIFTHRHKASLIMNKIEDELTPPNILFSEFIKSIEEESKQEDLNLAIEEVNQFPKYVSEAAISLLASPISTKKNKSRKRKRSRSKRGSEREKSLSSSRQQDTVQAFHFSEPEIYDTPEYRRSTMGKQSIHPKGRWCTRNISRVSYDEKNQTIAFQSPCFGVYALAIDRHMHMPFVSWYMAPHHGKFHHVTLTVITPLVVLEIHVTAKGFTLHIPKNSSIPIEPIQGTLGLYDFKQLLRSAGLNIFPERDAACYVQNVSEKHLPMEHHTYYSMASFCLCYRFHHSPWNRLSHRRRIIILVEEIRSLEPDMPRKCFEALVTPNECYRTKVTEKCSDNLNKMELIYDPEPVEQEYQPDFFFLLKPGFMEPAVKDAEEELLDLNFNVAQLLSSIRPLSFS